MIRSSEWLRELFAPHQLECGCSLVHNFAVNKHPHLAFANAKSMRGENLHVFEQRITERHARANGTTKNLQSANSKKKVFSSVSIWHGMFFVISEFTFPEFYELILWHGIVFAILWVDSNVLKYLTSKRLFFSEHFSRKCESFFQSILE